MDAGVSIQIRDAETGLPVPKNSPAVVTEGQRYTATFTVTNLSTKGGVATAAELQIKIAGYAGGTPFGFADQDGNLFAPVRVSPFLGNEALSFLAFFVVPAGTVGQTSALTLAAWTPPLGGGTLITGAAISEPLTIQSEGLAIPQIQTFIANDDWTAWTQTNGTISLHRLMTLPVGWGGGLQMDKTEGEIKFVGLPTNISRATLVLTPTEYFALQPGDESIVKVNFLEVGRDRQTSLAPLRIDITAPLKATTFTPQPGALSITLSPTPVPLTPARNWMRRYGSIRGVESARPRIEAS